MAASLSPQEQEPRTPPEQLKEDWRIFRRIVASFAMVPRRIVSMRIWRELFTCEKLLSWTFVGWTLAILIGSGAGMLSYPPLYIVAEICFALAAFVMFAKIAQIAVTTDYPFWERAVFTFVLFGVVGIVVVEVIRLIQSNRPPSQVGTSETTALIVIETAIHPGIKELSITNAGKVAISDIQISATEYFLDKDAWNAEQLAIADYQHIYGPSLVSDPPSIEAYWPPRKIDLKTLAPQVITFDEWPKEPTIRYQPFPGELKNYCFRITFRDSRNGEKYATYAVTSAIRGPQRYSSGAADDPGRPNDFGRNIPQLLIEHNRNLWKDGAKEYLPVEVSTAIRASETRYSKLSNAELRKAASEFIDKIQAFAERERTTNPMLLQRHADEKSKERLNAKTPEEQSEISRKYSVIENEELTSWMQANETEYQRNYRTEATLLHDELLRRLPEQPPKLAPRDYPYYDRLNGPQPLENIANQLKQFVELLPD